MDNPNFYKIKRCFGSYCLPKRLLLVGQSVQLQKQILFKFWMTCDSKLAMALWAIAKQDVWCDNSKRLKTFYKCTVYATVITRVSTKERFQGEHSASGEGKIVSVVRGQNSSVEVVVQCGRGQGKVQHTRSRCRQRTETADAVRTDKTNFMTAPSLQGSS